ncbi:uncharacterized protein [Dermacentor andersoni]|uniref:uncharacterized protein isoform X2 n=1 Tax=Dermacentor andersoni TaxID=34620 RepID=UPI003B3B681B
MGRNIVIAVAVVTFVAGAQVSGKSVQTSESPSRLTQSSDTTREQQGTSSGVQASSESVKTSEPPPSATQASGTPGEQPEESSGPVSTAAQIRDLNPDCNVTDERSHVYRSCTFACQLDEVIFLTQQQPCYLAGTSAAPPFAESRLTRTMTGTGICKDGECIKREQDHITFPDTVPKQGSTAEGIPTGNVLTENVTAENVTAETVTTENVKTENTSNGYVPTENVSAENFTIGNVSAENFPTENGKTEYTPTTTNAATENGSTENGKTEYTLTTTNAATENGPTENDLDCRESTDQNHVYLRCTYVCELDEVIVAPENSSCYISRANDRLASTNFTGEPNRIEGRCKNGVCVNITETQYSVPVY